MALSYLQDVTLLKKTLQKRTAFMLWRVGKEIRSQVEKELDPFKILPQQGMILELLASRPATQGELGRILGIDKNSMVKFVDHLEGLGLLTREPHPDDRRSHQLVLSTQGKKVISAATETASSIQETFLSSLKPVEKKIFEKVLAKLYEQSIIQNSTHS